MSTIARSEAPLALEDVGIATIRCNGGSMRPLMSTGDHLHLRKVDHTKLRTGDAVLVRENGYLQVHKIGAINGDRFGITNAFNRSPNWVGKNCIHGLLVRVNDRVVVSDDELEQR